MKPSDKLPTPDDIAPVELSSSAAQQDPLEGRTFEEWLNQRTAAQVGANNDEKAGRSLNSFSISLPRFLAATVILLLIIPVLAFGGYSVYNSLRKQPATTISGKTAGLSNILAANSQALHINFDTTIDKGKSLSLSGPLLIQNTVDSSGALSIQNAAGNKVFTVDTSNNQVNIGIKPPGNVSLDVNGDISLNGSLISAGTGFSLGAQGLKFGGTLVCSARGCISSSSPAPTPASPTIDVADLAFLSKDQTFSGVNIFDNTRNSFTGSGAGLTALDGSNITTGTLNDARLSANIAKLDTNQTFTGKNDFRAAAAAADAFSVQDAAGVSTLLSVDTTIRSSSGGNIVKIGDSTGIDAGTTILVLDSAAGNPTSNLLALSGGLFYNSATGKINIIENGVVKTLCNTTDLSCGGNTTTLQQAYDNSVSSPQITLDSSPGAGGLVIQDNASPLSGALFTVQSNGSGSKYLGVSASGVAVNKATAGYPLDVAGDVNSSTGYRVNGVLVCDSSGCNAASGSGNYIQNGTATQVGNYNIRSTAAGNVAAVIEGASGQSADMLDVQSFGGATKYLAVNTSGITVSGNINTTGQFMINGSQISSAALSNDSNLTKNSANNSLTGANSIAPTTNVTGLSVTQTTAVSPTADIFNVTNSTGATKYLQIDAGGNTTITGTLNATVLQQGSFNVLTANTSFAGDLSGAYNALAIGTGKVTSTHILDGTILNADINATAAIAYTKLSLSNSIVNTDISTSAAITYSKLNLAGSIANSDISGTAAIVDSKLAQITSANKVADSALSSNVPFKNGANTYTNTALHQLDSTVAFQIQNALANNNLFIANTTNSKIGIGLAPSTSGAILQVNGSTDSTAYSVGGTAGSSLTCSSGDVIQNPVINGGIITGGSCIANGGGIAPTLTQVYNNGSTSTDSTITLNTARAGVVIQDAATSIAANLFTVQNNGGSTKYLAVNSSGQVLLAGANSASTALVLGGDANLYRSAANVISTNGSIILGSGSLLGFGPSSTVKFQDGGSNILNVYTSSTLQLSLDASGNLTLSGNGLLVMGIKAADPTCTTGATYYSSATNSFRGCQGPSGATAWMDLITPPGSIITYGGSTAPAGFFIADGSAVSRTTYSRLFGVIGTTYGAGDGSTTFNLPDFRGRSAVGVNTAEVGRTDVSALGDNEGAVIGSRTPYHKATVVQPTISISVNPTISVVQPTISITAQPTVNIVTNPTATRTTDVALNDPGHSHTYDEDLHTATSGSSGNWNNGPFQTSNTSISFTGITVSAQPTFSISGGSYSLSGGSYTASGASASASGGSYTATGGTVGPQANTPTDTGAYLTVNYIIKF